MEDVKFIVTLKRKDSYWEVAKFEFDSLDRAQNFAKTLISHQLIVEEKEPFEVVISMDKIVLTNDEESEV